MNGDSVGIIQSELGIVAKDGIYFHAASAFAQAHLFHLMWGADYYCVSPYSVKRKGFDAFILFFVRNGSMKVRYRGKTFVAETGDVVFLNCNYAHHYWTEGGVRFYWFHFRGPAADAYCERYWNAHGAHFKNLIACERYFGEVQQMLRQKNADDDAISVRIHRLLAILSMPLKPSRQVPESIQMVQDYIDQNFNKPISVDDMAQQVSLSRHYFSRVFQAETGIAPHAYLIEVRIEHAKRLLSETTLSVEQISADCAFCSASNFIRTFRKSTGMTPHKFRQLF